MESTLRPRDIQARIRAGETPETVAEAAGSTVEKVMIYAGPVLAERAHVAERAQQSSVRRRPAGGEPTPRTLGEAVDRHLRGCNTDPDRVEWDAARREDGRWRLTATYALTERTGCGTFLYDPPGNYVTVEDDDARWLVGDLPTEPEETGQGATGGSTNRRRRLSAVPSDEELPLGDDAIGLVTDSEQASPPSTGTGGPAAEDPAEEDGGGAEPDEETGFFDQVLQEPDEMPTREDLPAVEETASSENAPEPDGTEREQEAAEEDAEEDAGDGNRRPPRRAVRKSRGRASVPSWDEIMFGDGRSDS